jgi:hypothetical protein
MTRNTLFKVGNLVERDGRRYVIVSLGESAPNGCLACLCALDSREPRRGVIAAHAVGLYQFLDDSTANRPD